MRGRAGMRRIAMRALARPATFGLALGIMWASVPVHAQTADRPEYAVGDTWEYAFRDTRYFHPGCNYRLSIRQVSPADLHATVDRPDGCDVSITGTMPVVPGKPIRFDREFNHFYYSATAYRALAFPLEVGKAWSEEYSYQIGSWVYTAALSARVVAYEPVTVPAGTFDAFKVIVTRRYQGDAPGRWTQTGQTIDTLWYAAKVRNIVKRDYRDIGTGVNPSPIVRELVSFVAGAP